MMGRHKSQLRDEVFLSMFRVSAYLILAVTFFFFFYIIKNGLPVMSAGFLLKMPSEGMTAGGIYPAIVGTALVTLLTALFSLPLGVGAAIYLTQYASDNWGTRFLRLSIRNLSGVPSIVFGLFGLAFFVNILNMKPGILTAGMTLGLLVLPWTITTAEESLRSVPNGFREAAIALGAGPWFTIRSVILPTALPGILTGLVLGMARAAGETAPILFVGVSFYLPQLPKSLFDQFMALPYHLYVLSTQHHSIELVRPIAFGTSFVLVAVILVMSGSVVVVRMRLRRKYQQW
jgi:phosphate transport system permease protein